MNTHLLTWWQERCPERIATIDMDATYMPTTKGEAKWSYKGERANQSMNASWAERDMMLFPEYREGNVNPGAQHADQGEDGSLLVFIEKKRYYFQNLLWCAVDVVVG